MPHDNQEQAFPQPVTVGPNDDLYPAYPGMTLRDYFAATAMQSVIMVTSAGQHDAGALRNVPPNASAELKMAHDAYALADAMLEARK